MVRPAGPGCLMGAPYVIRAGLKPSHGKSLGR